MSLALINLHGSAAREAEAAAGERMRRPLRLEGIAAG